MTRFAIRNSSGEWRSARWSDSFGEWESAQLWENAKTAKREVRRWAEREIWKDRVRVPAPVDTFIVAITIPEPTA